MVNWVTNLIVAASHLSIISIGEAATFAAYSALTVLSLAYVVHTVPETRSLTLTQIEQTLNQSGTRARRTAAGHREA